MREVGGFISFLYWLLELAEQRVFNLRTETAATAVEFYSSSSANGTRWPRIVTNFIEDIYSEWSVAESRRITKTTWALFTMSTFDTTSTELCCVVGLAGTLKTRHRLCVRPLLFWPRLDGMHTHVG